MGRKSIQVFVQQTNHEESAPAGLIVGIWITTNWEVNRPKMIKKAVKKSERTKWVSRIQGKLASEVYR